MSSQGIYEGMGLFLGKFFGVLLNHQVRSNKNSLVLKGAAYSAALFKSAALVASFVCHPILAATHPRSQTASRPRDSLQSSIVAHSSTNTPSGEAVGESKKPNACAAGEITFPKKDPSFAVDMEFNPLFIPKFLIHDIPFGIIKTVGWTVIPVATRQKMVTDSISAEAIKDPMLSSMLSEHEILATSQELGVAYGSKGNFPDKFGVKKSASALFVASIVEKQLHLLALPCANPKKDYPLLVKGILAGFNECLGRAQSNKDYNICTAQFEATAHYRVGSVALQVLLKDSLGGSYPNTTDGKRQRDEAIRFALSKYERCAMGDVYADGKKDRELQTKVCVSEAILRTVGRVAESKISDRLKSVVPDAKTRDKLVANVSRQLTNPPCTFARQLQNKESYSRDEYAGLKDVFTQKGGPERLKAGVFACADQISEIGGQTVVEQTITHQPALVKQFSDANGHLSTEGAAKISALSDDAIKQAYRPCVAQLKAHKAEHKQSIIDPSECEDAISGYVGGKVISSVMPAKFDEITASIKNPANRALAEQQKTLALKEFERCQQEHATGGQAQTIKCLSSNVEKFAGDFAVLTAKEKLGSEYIDSKPEIAARIKRITEQCIQERFGKLRTIEQLSSSLDGLGSDCSQRVQADVVPMVAADQIAKNYTDQKLSPDEFLKEKLPVHTKKFLAELGKAKTDSEQSAALAKFQGELSWDAFNDIGTKKTEEMFPINKPGLSAEERAANQKIHNTIHQNILTDAAHHAIVNPATSADALENTKDQFTQTLATEQVHRVLSTQIKDKAQADKIQNSLTGELKDCQSKNSAQRKSAASQGSLAKSIDCAGDFQKSAAWTIYQAAAHEGLDGALGELRKTDPAFAAKLHGQIAEEFMNSKVEARLKGAALDESARDTVLNDLTASISGRATKEIFHQKVASMLPAGAGQFKILEASELTLDACLKKIPASGISKDERKTQTNACLGQYVKAGAQSATGSLVNSAASKYIVDPALKASSEAIQKKFKTELEKCIAQIKSAPTDASFSNEILKCSTLYASKAAIDLGTLRASADKSRSDHILPPKPTGDVEKLAGYVADACFYGRRGACAEQIQSLQNSLSQVAQKPGSTADDLKKAVYASPMMDSILQGALAHQLEGTLNLKLKPYKSADDRSNTMEGSIYRVASASYLKPLLATPHGKAFIDKLKTRIATEPGFDPSKDRTVAAEFKTLMTENKGMGSFTDYALKAVAEPSFNKQWSDNISAHGPLALGLGMWMKQDGLFKSISANAVDFEHVMNTPSGQAARDYFYQKVLTKSLASLGDADVAVLNTRLPPPLAAKILAGEENLTAAEQAQVESALGGNHADLAAKIRPLSSSQMAKIKKDLEVYLNKAVKEVK